jgi:hypothetical protein
MKYFYQSGFHDGNCFFPGWIYGTILEWVYSNWLGVIWTNLKKLDSLANLDSAWIIRYVKLFFSYLLCYVYSPIYDPLEDAIVFQSLCVSWNRSIGRWRTFNTNGEMHRLNLYNRQHLIMHLEHKGSVYGDF